MMLMYVLIITKSSKETLQVSLFPPFSQPKEIYQLAVQKSKEIN